MGTILYPIEWVVAWIMVQFHTLWTALGMEATSGWTWALSIVGLVVVMRILLIPLFVRQIKASRQMQLIQPELRKIQQKYKGKKDDASRQAMTKETMATYKDAGTNPFASCLPILLQAPIFFGLFRVLNYNVVDEKPVGALTAELARQAKVSELLGAPLSATFLRTDVFEVRIVTVVLIILMSATTFTTQRQLMRKNMPAAALEGNPFIQQQKILLYALPVVFAVSGVNFPVGVLIYWLTTNLWSMGQQFFVIRRMPAPGSPAERALQERRARKRKGLPLVAEDELEEPVEEQRGQRAQPKRKDRKKRSAADPSSVERRQPSAGSTSSNRSGPGKAAPDQAASGKAGPSRAAPKKPGQQAGSRGTQPGQRVQPTGRKKRQKSGR